jgi:predicted dehydrogenase
VKTDVTYFHKLYTLLVELEAFADAASGRAPYPIKPQEMVDVVAAFEAIIRSMETGKPETV